MTVRLRATGYRLQGDGGMRLRSTACVAATMGLSLLGCGGGSGPGPAFASDWQNDDGKSIAAVFAKVGSTKLPTGKGVAVGITDTGLTGGTLDGSGKWTRTTAVDDGLFGTAQA